MFLTPAGTPTSYKPIYDVLSYLITQPAMSFAAAPFVILSFSGSLRAWSRVYFYSPIGVILTMAFFASPAKQYLIKLQERRLGSVRTTTEREDMKHDTSAPLAIESQTERTPVMGLPSDPGHEMDEMMEEVNEQVALRRRTGNAVDVQQKEAAS